MGRSNLFSCLTFMLILLSSSLVFAYEYGPKPEVQKPKPEEKQVPLSSHNYDKSPEPKSLEEKDEPNYDEEEAKRKGYDHYHRNIPTNLPDYYYGHDHHSHTDNIGIRGLILCKSHLNEYLPLAGAVARITCLAEDENGYEAAPFYTESHETNENGFFLAIFKLSEVIGSEKLKLKECKAFLEDSPLETCNVPTDVNNGITGALLSSSRFLQKKLMALYTVGPFIYTSDPKNSVPDNDDHSVPDGHY